MQNARGMQGNAGECKGNVRYGWYVPGECRGMQGGGSEMYGSVCKVPEECRGMTGESTGVGVKC